MNVALQPSTQRKVFHTKIAHNYKLKCYVNIYMCVSECVCMFFFHFLFSLSFSHSLSFSLLDMFWFSLRKHLIFTFLVNTHIPFSRFTRYPISFEQKSMHQRSFVCYMYLYFCICVYRYARMHCTYLCMYIVF